MNSSALVAIIMGSDSDLSVMQASVQTLDMLGIGHTVEIVSAHRTPDRMFSFAEQAVQLGYRIIIAGAGGAAHLPGMVAAKTILPVLGVPIPSQYLQGQDSLFSIVQMPKGVPVATFAIGEAGAINAALFAAAILALEDASIAQKLLERRGHEAQRVAAMNSTLAG